jgi:hypothetical protein
LALAENCTYTLTVAVPNNNPNLGDNGLPVITKTLTILGKKNETTIIKQTSAPSAPKFRIVEVAPGGDLTLDSVTLDNGFTSGDDVKTGRGGGIYNLGTLTVKHSILSHNTAAVGGGGIGNGDAAEAPNPTSGTLTLSDDSALSNNTAGVNGGAIANGFTSTINLTGCTISENTTNGGGGGIASQGKANLDDCTISGNTAPNGAGIINVGQVTLSHNSTLSGNTAANDGGGILNFQGGTATLTHSRVIKNNAGNNGGGIVNGTTVLLDHSDVTDNSAPHGGGGVFNQTGGSVTLDHSKVADNTPDNCSGVPGC